MSLKGIKQFVNFDWLRFAQGKKFVVTSCRDWQDYDKPDTHLGKKIEVAIVEDTTVYATGKGDEKISNLFEKVTFKVAKEINVSIGAVVEAVGVTATVYGEYQNQLALMADDIKVVTTAPAAKA